MSEQEDWRDEFVATLDHIDDAFDRVLRNSGPMGVLTPPDVHKLSEGLFLSAWTHWEEFLRWLMTLDLAHLRWSFLTWEVKDFRFKYSRRRLAQAILGHPDEKKWVEWSNIGDVLTRADALFNSPHRFNALRASTNDLDIMRRVRNAVAHKSDHAWLSFLKLARAAPFSLAGRQMKFITTGRFLSTATWGPAGGPVLKEGVARLRTLAQGLVP